MESASTAWASSARPRNWLVLLTLWPGGIVSTFRRTGSWTADMGRDICCGRVILHCNLGCWFFSTGLISCMRHNPSVVVSIQQVFFKFCFALELFDVYYQDVGKSGEKRAADNVSPNGHHAFAFGGLRFHRTSRVFGLDEAKTTRLNILHRCCFFFISDTLYMCWN